jgi:hypothetical protein
LDRRWFASALILVLAGVLVVGVFITRAQVLAAPRQPVAYSHQKHAEAGVQCLFCHTSALHSDIAGVPSVQKCMGCHTTIAADKSAIRTLAGYWERREPIPWIRVNKQPDFVYFSHQAHLAAGVNCENCHGNVGEMAITQPDKKMDMGWCLKCHLEQSEEKQARLLDCLTCHK